MQYLCSIKTFTLKNRLKDVFYKTEFENQENRRYGTQSTENPMYKEVKVNPKIAMNLQVSPDWSRGVEGFRRDASRDKIEIILFSI